jgi:hypothetical protein
MSANVKGFGMPALYVMAWRLGRRPKASRERTRGIGIEIVVSGLWGFDDFESAVWAVLMRVASGSDGVDGRVKLANAAPVAA